MAKRWTYEDEEAFRERVLRHADEHGHDDHAAEVGAKAGLSLIGSGFPVDQAFEHAIWRMKAFERAIFAPTVPKGFTITAQVYGDGGREISVTRGRSAAVAADLHRRRMERPGEGRAVEDWQVAEADTIDEARRTIMLAFGMAWFNRARAQLAKLAADDSTR